MGIGTIQRWFLGPGPGMGSMGGYDNFLGEGDFAWVLKGGPGGGKSSFMKRIGAAAEGAGLDVVYIDCPSDPGSLDGVYLPMAHLAWVDGTAPHVYEPACFGAGGAYLDLGAACDVAGLGEKGPEIGRLSARQRELQERAKASVRAASDLSRRSLSDVTGEAEQGAAAKRARAVAAKELPRAVKGTPSGAVHIRHLSAFGCLGRISQTETLSVLCKRLYLLDDRLGLAGPFLMELLKEARGRGIDALYCPDPIRPWEPEALILPACSLGFLASGKEEQWAGVHTARRLRLDAIADHGKLRAARPGLRADAKLSAALLDSSQSLLAEAREAHMELESLYRPHIDFAMLDAMAERAIAQVIERA